MHKSSVRVFCMYWCGAFVEYVDAAGAPTDWKYALTSFSPTLPFHAASGGNVKTFSTEPFAGGTSTFGRCSVSKTILAGQLSTTHMRWIANPGRAGSVRTSGEAVSPTRLDLPASRSIATTRRCGFTPSGSFWFAGGRMGL